MVKPEEVTLQTQAQQLSQQREKEETERVPPDIVRIMSERNSNFPNSSREASTGIYNHDGTYDREAAMADAMAEASRDEKDPSAPTVVVTTTAPISTRDKGTMSIAAVVLMSVVVGTLLAK